MRRTDRNPIDINHIGDSLVAENTDELSVVERAEYREVEGRHIGRRLDETRHLVIPDEHSLNRYAGFCNTTMALAVSNSRWSRIITVSTDVGVAFRGARRSVAGDGISTAGASSDWQRGMDQAVVAVRGGA